MEKTSFNQARGRHAFFPFPRCSDVVFLLSFPPLPSSFPFFSKSSFSSSFFLFSSFIYLLYLAPMSCICYDGFSSIKQTNNHSINGKNTRKKGGGVLVHGRWFPLILLCEDHPTRPATNGFQECSCLLCSDVLLRSGSMSEKPSVQSPPFFLVRVPSSPPLIPLASPLSSCVFSCPHTAHVHVCMYVSVCVYVYVCGGGRQG